ISRAPSARGNAPPAPRSGLAANAAACQKLQVPVSRKVRAAPGIAWEGCTCSVYRSSETLMTLARSSNDLTGRYATVRSPRAYQGTSSVLMLFANRLLEDTVSP